MTPRVLRADREWLWLAKPAGWPVFPLAGQDPAGTLYGWLIQERPEQDQPEFNSSFAGGVAHRLDNATSGVVLAARGYEALERARRAFRERRLVKTYRFLSRREVPWDEHHVTAPIAHHKKRRKRMVVQRGRHTPHRGSWQTADTRFRRLGPGLWQAVITTGCRHQIRVHAAFAGIAILGDRLYGGGPMPAGVAPDGADFALHHVGMTGLGERPPRLDPPDWWGEAAERMG